MLERCNFFLRFEGRVSKKYNALAHLLPDIGMFSGLTLENVRDIDVEGHAFVVQGL